MDSPTSLPTEWSLESEETTHDEFAGRDYTSVRYRQAQTGTVVYINEVIDGNNVWQYSVHHSGHDGDLGVADDLEAAKELAVTFMTSAAAGA